MDIVKQYATDKELETSGVWIDLGKGAKVLVARLQNPAHKARLREVLKPYKRKINRGVVDDEIPDDLINQVLAETILLNWEGIEENGSPVDYSVAKATEFLEKYPDFKADVVYLASNMETFRAQQAEEDEKN